MVLKFVAQVDATLCFCMLSYWMCNTTHLHYYLQAGAFESLCLSKAFFLGFCRQNERKKKKGKGREKKRKNE